MSRAAVYARVSTDAQDISGQVADLREYAGRRGFEVVEVYEDRGVSGAKDSRPALDRLMQDSRRRRFDVVLVQRFDRFARSTRHLLAALAEFHALGVDFVSLTEAVDTTTPAGMMVFTMVGAVAEFERELIRERVRAGIARARAKGARFGRPRRVLDLVHLQELRRSGLSLSQIAKNARVSKGTVVNRLRACPEKPQGERSERAAGVV